MTEDQRAERQEARPADPRLLPGHCHKCGCKRVDNPHPDAGKPGRYLEVGCEKECLPCTVLSRHQWARRAWKAEEQLRREGDSFELWWESVRDEMIHDTDPRRHAEAAWNARALLDAHPKIVGEKFTRAWINLDELPGGMMHSSEVGRFGPVPASTSCWITTSEKEAERMRADGPVLEIFTHTETKD